MAKARARFRIRPRFFVFLFIVIFLIGMGIRYAIRPYQQVEIQWGGLTIGRVEQGTIVWNETLSVNKDTGKINYLVAEGESVEAEDPLVQVYRVGYSDTYVNNVLEIQQNILTYLLDRMSDQVDPQLTLLQNEIAVQVKEISACQLAGKTSDVLWREARLRQALLDRRTYLVEQAQNDPYLQRLLQQEQEALANVSDYISSIGAPSAGLVSFYFDGCEELNLSTLQGKTYSQIKEILKAADGIKKLQQQGYTPLFKIIDGNRWVYAVLATSARSYQVDQMYEIVFEGYSDYVFLGKYTGEVVDNNQRVLLFDITQPPGALLNAREIGASIGKYYEGLKVPVAALKKQGGQTGVLRIDDGKKTFMPVTVIAQDAGYAIVEQAGGDGVLEVGMQVVGGR
nr:HlyD family efflux transporter periplasmic adaptor subunit [bacterium]